MRLKGFGYHLATQEQLIIFWGPFTLFQGWMIWGKEVLDGGHHFYLNVVLVWYFSKAGCVSS